MISILSPSLHGMVIDCARDYGSWESRNDSAGCDAGLDGGMVGET